MQRRIGQDDDCFARGVLEIFDQGGLARFQGFGDFWVDASVVIAFVRCLNSRVQNLSRTI